jgi:hypothetical protein
MENNDNEQHMDLLDEIVTASAAEPMDLSGSVRDLTLAVKKALEEIAVRIFLLWKKYFDAFPFLSFR